jgi:hypothetical protein
MASVVTTGAIILDPVDHGAEQGRPLAAAWEELPGLGRLFVKRLQRDLRARHHVMANLKQVIRVSFEVRAAAAMKLSGRFEPIRRGRVSRAANTTDDQDGLHILGHETNSSCVHRDALAMEL